MNNQNRFKSWALWVSLAGALWVILSNIGVTEAIGVTETEWNTLLDAIGSVLIVFGVVNNPTDSSHF